ncbi:tRNA (adenosine(37)-N6)-threonylcarbamoyltransferase complex ATPase subunit type 1 TsaE [Oceanobacillus saliphilus]|uniref:tRNA (adenosine(37)-N6)-threonylcarbamoyltransferase complex ATPase subunit type 1 TsaE n=1 Tax=Oceanobacillus saliphilus TaxID=2925834 RepID=UPI00201E07F5|nr:tRNA (adenosine(37)-N6)-threonylcarbamoyltransferase complex ATPase subunit type 1 TsaE [Oceanobacillus saliphilus]
MKKIQTNTEHETISVAEKLALLLKPGDVITLEGELGAGKTTFTKGLANGLGVKRNISSPTFTIIKEYEGELPLYHMDVYRLEHSEEDIGFDEYFYGNGITVVEWAQFIEEFLPEERLNINISYIDENKRELEFTSTGTHFKWIVHELTS